MKRLLNSSLIAFITFALLIAAIVTPSIDSVSLASSDESQSIVRQGRGKWVKAARSSDAQSESLPQGQPLIAGEAQSTLIEIRSGGKSGADKFSKKAIRFDVSENATRFIFDDTPLFADGAPAYGNEFITEGYIYPAGTLNGTNGVNPDGTPEFPDKVIGRWTCRGWHVGEGAKTVTGPWVITHQIYDFDDNPGRITIATDGLELVDLNVAIERAIIGGTGPYARARGEAIQTMIGFNQINGVNLRFELKVVMK